MPANKPVRPTPGVALALPRVDDETTQRAFDRVTIASQQLVSRIGAVDTSVTALAATIPSLMWVNVSSFGAKGNGIADDTAAIQAAINAAEGAQSVVYVPSGVHLISDTLFIPDKVVLTGIGRGDVGKIQASAAFPNDGRPMVRLGRAADPFVFGSRVESIILDANSRAAVCVYSTAANEQCGVRFVVATNFTTYGIHFDTGSSGIHIEDVEVYPQAAGATSCIYLSSAAIDNLIKRATVGVSALATNGIHLLSSQCVCIGVHVENCTTGIRLDSGSSSVLLGISGPGVVPNVADLILDTGSNHFIGMNLVKNNATRLINSAFGGYTNADPFMPLWVGGDSIIGGAMHEPIEVVPAQITSNQNNYAPPGVTYAQVMHISSDAPRDITGIVLANPGRVLKVRNRGAFNVTLKHQNGGSLAANQFNGRGNADTVLLPGTTAELYKSTVDGKVEVMNNP